RRHRGVEGSFLAVGQEDGNHAIVSSGEIRQGPTAADDVVVGMRRNQQDGFLIPVSEWIRRLHGCALTAGIERETDKKDRAEQQYSHLPSASAARNEIVHRTRRRRALGEEDVDRRAVTASNAFTA